jgi:hypothetical protein
MPVATLDGEDVRPGHMGSITKKGRETYWQSHSDPRFPTPIAYR